MRNFKAIEAIWRDPVGRTQGFFGKTPYHVIPNEHKKVAAKYIFPYQLGAYLYLWGELYGFPRDVHEICATGRGTGKTSVLQELNAADMACFMPYMLQFFHGTKKPVDVTIVFVGSQKKYAIARMDNVKRLILSNAYLERHLVDNKAWTKDKVDLRNRCKLRAEPSSDAARGYHSEDPEGVVIYFLEEFAFWGGSQCLDGQTFTEEIADQSFGARVGAFTTPYGKRGGAWWAWNQPHWAKFNFPTRMNPRTDKKFLAGKIKRLLAQGRQIVVDQEIRGLFVDDAGLFFTMEIWLKSLNHSMDWLFSDQDSYRTVVKEVTEMYDRGYKEDGYFLLGLDPNQGSKKAGADPFGISLVKRVGRKYINKFSTAFNGRSHEEIMRILKPLCLMFKPKKISIDGGGGYHTGPVVMIKDFYNAGSIQDIPESNQSIVGYMSKLRSLMAMGRFEQPPSESLRDSQMSMVSIGDNEADESANGSIKFQTTGKKNGIPCDLAAMGLAISRENVTRQEIALQTAMKSETGIFTDQTETRKVFDQLRKLEGMGLEGVRAGLTGVGI